MPFDVIVSWYRVLKLKVNFWALWHMAETFDVLNKGPKIQFATYLHNVRTVYGSNGSCLWCDILPMGKSFQLEKCAYVDTIQHSEILCNYTLRYGHILEKRITFNLWSLDKNVKTVQHSEILWNYTFWCRRILEKKHI